MKPRLYSPGILLLLRLRWTVAAWISNFALAICDGNVAHNAMVQRGWEGRDDKYLTDTASFDIYEKKGLTSA